MYNKGIRTDNNLSNQSPNSVRYAKNAVLESSDGDIAYYSRENSNEFKDILPPLSKCIGSLFINSEQTVIFSVSDTNSHIGIFDGANYTDIVSFPGLLFSYNHKIISEFNLRRGCKRVIYFADGLNQFRYVNLDDLDLHRDDVGNWVVEKFNFFTYYDKVPKLEVTTKNSGGRLNPGGYSVGIQYLDKNLNTTEWIFVTKSISIYNDNTTKSFEQIVGSTGGKTFYQDFPRTTKSISVKVTNFDINYDFYRLAFIEASDGDGIINNIYYTDYLDKGLDTFIFNGNNYASKGVLEEIKMFTDRIESVKCIARLESRLWLGNTTAPTVPYCNLQKYASKISSNLLLKKVTLNDITDKNNPKNPTVKLNCVGIMPGEIRSYGIVWVFKSGFLSPVFHIPGRNSAYISDLSSDNTCTSSYYTSMDDCIDYWGVDNIGEPLEGKKVRHHRFPTRNEINEPLISKEDTTINTSTSKTLVLRIFAESFEYEELSGSIDYRVDYEVDGVAHSYAGVLYLDTYNGEYFNINETILETEGNIINIVITTQQNNSNIVTNIHFITSILGGTSTVTKEQIVTNIFGIEFSNIEFPTLADTGGYEVVGYYIVSNKKDGNKTVVDNGISFPMIEEKREGQNRFIGFGHLTPNTSNISKFAKALFVPSYMFLNETDLQTTSIVSTGYYNKVSKSISTTLIDDVQPGTSYDKTVHKRRERDEDGYSLFNMIRYNTLNYNKKNTEDVPFDDKIHFLDALSEVKVLKGNSIKELYNVSADNKIAVINSEKDNYSNRIEYVTLKDDISDPYGNFRLLPYYMSSQYMEIDDKCNVFDGKAYISPLTITSSMFYDIKLRFRKTKKGIINFIIGVYAIVAGVALTIVSAGALTKEGIMIAGLGVNQISTGIKKASMAITYKKKYEEGLADTVNDIDTDSTFSENPEDDEIQWLFDIAKGLWVESEVNIHLRMGNTIGLTSFLNPLYDYTNQDLEDYCLSKNTVVEHETGGRNYLGYAMAELYELNLDYIRHNTEKVFFHLPFEYKCCSECSESFPHRIYASEIGYQEELQDNMRVVLSNNYIDLEGDTGEINNMFVYANKLYVHTERCLWVIPNSKQERVTGDIISFIGTGEVFSQFPRKIVDSDTGLSAGVGSSISSVKTPYGVYFTTTEQNRVWYFNGTSLEPISDAGLSSYFKDKLRVEKDIIMYYDPAYQRIFITSFDDKMHQSDSFTLSYSLKFKCWVSYHSYIPQHAFNNMNRFFTIVGNHIYEHNIPGTYGDIYGFVKDFELEFVLLSKNNVDLDHIRVDLETSSEDNHTLDSFFQTLIASTEHHITGELDLVNRENVPKLDFFTFQINNISKKEVKVLKKQGYWYINRIRDNRIDNNQPMFLYDNLPANDFKDKILNTSIIDYDKDWKNKVSLRGKYFSLRFKFTSFNTVKLVFKEIKMNSYDL